MLVGSARAPSLDYKVVAKFAAFSFSCFFVDLPFYFAFVFDVANDQVAFSFSLLLQFPAFSWPDLLTFVFYFLRTEPKHFFL